MSNLLERQLMSLYVTLLLSVGCLGYAELGQKLPETPFIYSIILLALGVAYWSEGRFSLSMWASNALAGVVLLGGVSWLLYKNNSAGAETEANVNQLRLMVSYAGPVLCSLMLAKLFRPKSGSDQWLLQLLGLVQVILASVLAMGSRMDRDAPLFPMLMLMYLCSVAWACRLLYLRHEQEQTGVVMNQPPTLRWFSFKPLTWFLLSMVVAVVIYFCLPQGGLEASFFNTSEHTETGSTARIDLNAEGTVQVSDEKVIRVRASNAAGLMQLSESLRLRGAILCDYDERNCVWKPFPTSMLLSQPVAPVPGVLAAGASRVEYEIDVSQIQQQGKTRLSRFATDQSIPLYLMDPPSPSNLLAASYSVPGAERERAPLRISTFELQSWVNLRQRPSILRLTHDYSGKMNSGQWEQVLYGELPSDYYNYLRTISTVPRRIARSERIGTLSYEILKAAKLDRNSPDKDKARALELYLASNKYAYSLERKKQDTSIDPIEDFLLNVKEGHCERYSAALAVMLRTVGVKSRIIMGFRGAEYEQNGFMVVRQLHAHAWVEALVGEEKLPDGSRKLTWMTLDATPANEARSVEADFTSPLTFARYLWEFFILDFAGQARRNKILALLQNTWLGKLITWWTALPPWQAWSLLALAIVGFVALIWWLIRWRRRIRQRRFEPKSLATMTIPFYYKLLSVLGRKGYKPHFSQTPAEFAVDTRRKLLNNDQSREIADIPAAMVPPYYAVRYGGQSLTEQQQTQVDQQLQSLQLALQR